MNTQSTITTAPDSAPCTALKRTLVLAIGATANAIAARAATQSLRWLGDAAPVVYVDCDAIATVDIEEQTPHLTAALDTLGSRKIADGLRRHGLSLQEQDELQLWLLCAEQPEACLEQNESSTERLEPLAHRAAHLARLAADMAWQRLRVQAVTNAILVGDPAAEADLVAERQALVAAGAADIYLAGPVNQEHLRLDEEDWQTSTAAALNGLILGTRPSHGCAQTGDERLIAVGGAVWESPRKRVCRWLELHATVNLCSELLAKPSDGEQECEHPAGPLREDAGVDSYMQTLVAQLPAPRPTRFWRTVSSGWPDVATLEESLNRNELEQLALDQLRLSPARHLWRDQQMHEWNRLLDEIETRSNRRAQQNPSAVLQSYRRHLTTRLERLRQDSAAIEGRLEQLDRRVEQAEQTCISKTEIVRTVCAELPAYSLRGATTLLLQPWRWPMWAWSALHRLPRAGQRLLNAQAQYRRAQWEEGNWHLLRQLYLAMQQEVNNRLADLDALVAHLETVRDAAQTQQRTIEEELEPPWHADRLAELGALLLAEELAPLLQAMIGAQPLLAWPALSAADITRRVALRLGDALRTLVGRHATDCLLQATPGLPIAQPGTEAGWSAPTLVSLPEPSAEVLAQLERNAVPLWPRSHLEPERCSSRWLLMAPPTNGSSQAGLGYDHVVAWCRGKGFDLATMPVDALILLHLERIDLYNSA